MNDHLKTNHPQLSQKIEEEHFLDTDKEETQESKYAYIFTYVLPRKVQRVHLSLIRLMSASIYIIK